MPTKKDMILAAEIVKARTPARDADSGIRERLTDAFAEYFARNNPRFDRARFLKACGV